MWNPTLTKATICCGFAFCVTAFNSSVQAKCADAEQKKYASCLLACTAGQKACKSDPTYKEACATGWKACGAQCQKEHKGCIPAITGCFPSK